MRIARRLVFGLLCLIAVSAAPDAEASQEWTVETFFFDWQNDMYVGWIIDDCGGWELDTGDTTNYENGELKLVRKTNCFTHEVVDQWWRWQALCGTNGYWYMISDPSWQRTWYC